MQGLCVVVCPNLYRRRAASKNRSLIFSAHALDALPLFSARATCKPGALGSEESSPGAPAVTVLENTRNGRRMLCALDVVPRRGPAGIGASSRTRPLVPAGSTARRPATPTSAVREPKKPDPRSPIIQIQTARVTAPTRGRLAALRALPGRPVAARALRQVHAQTGGLQIFDSRTERAPGAGGRGIRRAHASLCGWWALRGARSGHGRAFKEFAAAGGCPAGRSWSERRARGRGAAQGCA